MVIQETTWELIFLRFSQEIPKDSLILSAWLLCFLLLCFLFSELFLLFSFVLFLCCSFSFLKSMLCIFALYFRNLENFFIIPFCSEILFITSYIKTAAIHKKSYCRHDHTYGKSSEFPHFRIIPFLPEPDFLKIITPAPSRISPSNPRTAIALNGLVSPVLELPAV